MGKKRKKGNKRLCKKMKKLIEVVMQYGDSDGRVLSEPFYKLPSRKELPDYYEIIKKPVDIAKMQQRIDDEKYEDMSGLQKDFMQLCANTQQYNEDGSLIFEDSIVLQSVFTNARERLEQEPDEPDDEEEEMMEQDDENSRMSMGSTSSSKKSKKKDKEGSKSAKKKKKRWSTVTRMTMTECCSRDSSLLYLLSSLLCIYCMRIKQYVSLYNLYQHHSCIVN